MSLATAVIRSASDKNTASLFLQETKIIKALLKQYEARGYLMVDVLHPFSEERLQPLLQGSKRRKKIWIYHHIGPWDSDAWKKIYEELPDLKLLIINGPIRQDQLIECFRFGVKTVITTGSGDYSPVHLLFSRKFYANLSAGAKLEDAFEQARIFVEMEQHQAIQKPMPFSEWLASQWLDEKNSSKKTVPWGLFYSPEGGAILSMSLPQRSDVHIVSKQEQRSWLLRQRFKDIFLKDWGHIQHQYHLLAIEDGPLGMAQLCQVVREEVCLPYQHAGVRVLKIDFSASLEEAKIKLLAQLRDSIGKPLDLSKINRKTIAQQTEGLVFLVKIFQSEWPSYGATLLEWMRETAVPSIYPEDGQVDVISICTLIADEVEHAKKSHALFSIKRIADSCKVFAPSDLIDFRL